MMPEFLQRNDTDKRLPPSLLIVHPQLHNTNLPGKGRPEFTLSHDIHSAHTESSL